MIAKERNKVPVLDFPNGLHFCREFSVALATDMYQLLNGYNTAVFQLGLVNITKTSRAYEAVIVEAICSFKEICKSELPQGLQQTHCHAARARLE